MAGGWCTIMLYLEALYNVLCKYERQYITRNLDNKTRKSNKLFVEINLQQI